MTYAMFDDQTPDNPKLMQAGPLAGWLWFSAICWCNRHPGQNGVVTTRALRALWSPYGSHQGRAQAVRKLVASGLFIPMEGKPKDPCFKINDWHIYQAEAVAKSQQRRRDRERKRKDRADVARKMSAGQSMDSPSNVQPSSRARVPVPVPVPINSPNGELGDTPESLTPKVTAAYRKRYIAARPELGDWQQGARCWTHFRDVAAAAQATPDGFEVALGKALDAFFADAWAIEHDYPPGALASGFGKYFAPPPKTQSRDERRDEAEQAEAQRRYESDKRESEKMARFQ